MAKTPRSAHRLENGDVVTCEEDDRTARPTHVRDKFVEMTTFATFRSRGMIFLPILDIGALPRRLSRTGECGGHMRDEPRGGEL